MSDWNPAAYLKFERERTQPVRDLVARIELSNPARIIDLGCGPGNSTAVLRERWPEAHIVGLDCSPAMIQQAKATRSDIEWVQADAAADLSRLGSFDVVFANASLQWLPNHRELMPRLMESVNPGGILAAQIPRFEEMPMADAIQAVAKLPEFAGFFVGFEPGFHHFETALYYDTLHGLSRTLELWVTHYYHVLDNHTAIVEFMRPTGLRPYLDCLPEKCRAGFTASLLERVQQAYPSLHDGRVFFIFKRFFILACKR